MSQRKPNKSQRLLAALCLAGEQTTKAVGTPSMQACVDVLGALDVAGLGNDVPIALECAVKVHLVSRRVRVTEHGAEWVPPTTESPSP